MGREAFLRSSLLVLTSSSAQAVLPSTLISRVDTLLDLHRIPEAVALAHQHQGELSKKSSASEDELDEIRYVFQRAGFQCFSETRFEEAGEYLFDGELDPRILVSYFPNLRGSLFTPSDALDIFSGVAEHMPTEDTIEDIIVHNLVRNYSPHLPPDTRSAPPTTELRKIYIANADAMLELFLRKSRAQRLMAHFTNLSKATQKAKVDPIDIVIDTVLAKLLARAEKTAELYAMLNEPNQISLAELEPVLKQTGQYNALCMLYRSRNEHDKLLDVWSNIAEGIWSDEDIPDPVGDIIRLLEGRRGPERAASTQKWGVWLTKRDPERGLKLLMSGRRRDRDKPDDDLALLQQLREAHPEAADRFLEYLVLQRRSTSKDLHTQFATACAEQLAAVCEDDGVFKLWRAKASSYASSKTESTSSFFSYFSSTTPDTPHKRIRLKTILFLQGSTLYDVSVVQGILLNDEKRVKVLALEKAILEGKLGDHRQALSTLVHSLHDSTSAETYCALGGEVVPSKTAHAIGEKCGLKEWAAALFPAQGKAGKQRDQEDGGKLKKELLKVLLEVYVNDGESSRDRANRLLNAQAVNLDVIDAVSLVPDSWPLDMMSSFLARSFRRTIHMKHEGEIVKTISAGQNLEIAERTWLVLRDQGAVLEEAGEDDDGGPTNEVLLDEKEKSLLFDGVQPPTREFVASDEKRGLAEETGEDVGLV